MEESEIIALGQYEPGKKITIVNKGSPKNYTFRNGEYGDVTFTLIVGGSFSFTVGTKTPIIESNDP